MAPTRASHRPRLPGEQRVFPLPLVVGAAMVALLAGVAIGRVTAPAPAPAAPLPRGAPALAGPGPTTVQSGVPVGYTQTEDGAVAAATQYVAGVDAKRLFSDEARSQALDVMAVPAVREELAEQMAPGIAAALEGLGQTGDEVAADPTVVVRAVPAGYAVESYSDEEAVVDVWATVIFFAEGRQALGDVWTTQRVTVQWQDGDWRLASFSVTDGPVPPETTDPSASGVAARINDLDEFVAVPVPE